jgi:hypothetical protein
MQKDDKLTTDGGRTIYPYQMDADELMLKKAGAGS